MNSVVVQTIDALRTAIRTVRAAGKSIGLVPTMGALHEGHASLLRLARGNDGFVVATIFVNPTQFGPTEDLNRYPRPLTEDLRICAEAGANLVFVPDTTTVYPLGFRTFVEVEGLQNKLCGASRPGHFRGVCTVVSKLLNLVQPDRAYFGQKDAQQVRILQQMVRDLDMAVEVVVGPTVREQDGLALSSRNQYLEPDQRRQAPVLYRALRQAKASIDAGERDPAVPRRVMIDEIAAVTEAVLDYAEVVDADTLTTPTNIVGPTLLALAVKFGTTRLIDNLLVHADERSVFIPIPNPQSAIP